MERLQQLIETVGFDLWGCCRLAALPPLLPVRSRSRIFPDACGIIVLLSGYYTEKYTNRNIARYAIADDYHAVTGAMLAQLCDRLAASYPGERFAGFVDASPIDEVAAAVAAGLGERGRNGLLLNPVYGSYCFIAEIVTTMPLSPGKACKAKELCSGCGACIAACPTGALSEAGFQKALCRSQITQKKGELSEWEREQVRQGGFAWGCDRCTDACPVNRRAQKSQTAAFYQNPVPLITAENAAQLCRTKAFGWRGEAVLLRNLALLQEDG